MVLMDVWTSSAPLPDLDFPVYKQSHSSKRAAKGSLADLMRAQHCILHSFFFVVLLFCFSESTVFIFKES